MRAIILSFRMLRRDWYAGELRVLFLALIVAVASVTSVGFFTDRIQRALEQQSNELLGADLAVNASHPLAKDLQAVAVSFGASTAQTAEFPSMVIAGRQSMLASVKAVSSTYPLRGALRISHALFAADAPAQGVPATGTVWLESRLVAELGVKVGDQITLGESNFIISAILTSEPARAGGRLFSIAPRLMLNMSDLDKTGLIQAASRVRYSLLLAADINTIEGLTKAIKRHLQIGERLETIEDARPEIRRALDRSRRFLGLAALVSVLLAGVAVSTSTRRFVRRHLDSCAVMRCLGATQNEILRIFLYQILWLCLIGGVTGSVLGYILQFGLVSILSSVATLVLPQPSLLPGIIGMLIGLVTLAGFSLPPLIHLKHVPPLRIMRRELGKLPAQSAAAYLAGGLTLLILILMQAHDIKLGLYVLAGSMGGLVMLFVMAIIVIRLLRRLNQSGVVAWRFGIGNITRRVNGSILQIMSFGLGIMVLLLLTLIRDDLLKEWETSLPVDAPNRFLINIQPDQLDQLKQYFVRQGLTEPTLFPMVRGRLIAIDDRPVSPDSYENERASHLVAREFNLSWTADLHEDNKIISGKWWSPQASGQDVLSIEKGLADTLGIKLGDTLTFSVADEKFRARVTSLREVDWDSFQVNFFVLVPPGVLNSYPATYITSIYLAEDNGRILNGMVRAFPNITVIDVAAVMRQVRSMIERVTLAVEYVFMFTLLAGVLVMYAAIHATLDERIQESAILRTLGADRGLLLKGMFVEFTGLGALSGLVAAGAATLLGYVLAKYVFHLDYAFNGWVWLIGITGGAVGVCIAGLLGTQHILRRPPLQVLNEST